MFFLQAKIDETENKLHGLCRNDHPNFRFFLKNFSLILCSSWKVHNFIILVFIEQIGICWTKLSTLTYIDHSTAWYNFVFHIQCVKMFNSFYRFFLKKLTSSISVVFCPKHKQTSDQTENNKTQNTHSAQWKQRFTQKLFIAKPFVKNNFPINTNHSQINENHKK